MCLLLHSYVNILFLAPCSQTLKKKKDIITLILRTNNNNNSNSDDETIEELLERKSSGSGQENRDQRPWEFIALTTQHFLDVKFGTNFVDKRRLLGRYSSLAD
jgi:hypothetical protein